jgi:predicted O-methyltransferase YrrM
MYSSFQLALKYLNYYFTASNGKGHGMHSPFVFDFITKVLNDKTAYPEYEQVEKLRREMLNTETLLEIEDLGAGSRLGKYKQRTVSSIAKHALKSPKFSQLLFKIARYYKCKSVVELGTSLGITSSYFSLAVGNDGKLSTVEGASAVAKLADENFKKLGLKNIQLINESFDDWFINHSDSHSTIDLAFIDGNHQLEPTVKYFNELLPKLHNDTIFIFDDIHWSHEMEQAWSQIKAHPSVTCSIDLFFIGLVFFRREIKENQHFTIRF